MKIIGFHLEESKRNKGAMLLIATDEEGDRWVIGGNVEALAKAGNSSTSVQLFTDAQ